MLSTFTKKTAAMAKLSVAQRKALGKSARDSSKVTTLMNKYNITASTVRRWRDEAAKKKPNCSDARRNGRPRVLPQPQRSSARRMARRGQSVPAITRSVNLQMQQPVSAATVRRALTVSRSPLKYVVVKRDRRLSTKNATARLEFARQHQMAQSGSWLFTDAKMFYCYQDGVGKQRRRWCNASDQDKVLRSNNPYVLHMYAIVGKGFKSELWFVPLSAPAGTKHRKSEENYSSEHFIALLPKFKKALSDARLNSARHPLVIDNANTARLQGVQGSHQAAEPAPPAGLPCTELGHQHHRERVGRA